MKVTVVIPSYNHRNYIAQAIHSVMRQSYGDRELIVIDDGSTDGSRSVIADLHRQYSERFRFVARENRGLVATLKQGLQMARGEYFCELASDDYLHTRNIEKRAAYLDAHPEIVAVFTDGLCIDQNDREIGPVTKEKIKNLYRSENPVPGIINNTTPVFATALMRTTALRQCGGFDADTFRYYEDIDTPIRLLQCGKFGYLDERLFYRRIHQTNVSSVTNHIRREKIYFYRKMLGYPGMENYQRLLRNRMRRSSIALGRVLAKAEAIDGVDYQVFSETSRKFPFDLRLHWYGLMLKLRYRRQRALSPGAC